MPEIIVKILFSITLNTWLFFILINLFLLFIRSKKYVALLNVCSVVMGFATLVAGSAGFLSNQSCIISLPLSWFGFHSQIALNPLSSFFLMITGLGYCVTSLFSLGYFNNHATTDNRKIQLFQNFFVFSLFIVFTANDPVSFLFFWELMTFSSYFLVTSITPNKITRKAGLLYLGMAHLGFFFIITAFFLLFSSADISAWHFNAIGHSVTLTQPIANVIFIFAFIGFGAKAGLFPAHVWLPEAHPAAPTPISALMSGVMLTTAIYALYRLIFNWLLPYQAIGWGVLLVTIGLISMLIGAIQGAIQTEMKRLLAYSSMENMGFIVVALGLGVIFYHYHLFALTDIALLIVFLHCFNHHLFKSLLFLSSGAVSHRTGNRSLSELGGLIHAFPWVSVCTFIGVLSMAGIPLLNGFISEWLMLSIFFRHTSPHFIFTILSPLIVSIIVFVFGITSFIGLKFFGIGFLGEARHQIEYDKHPITRQESTAVGILAFLCVLLGLWPNPLIQLIQKNIKIMTPMVNDAMHASLFSLSLTQQSASAGFNPMALILFLLLLMMLVYFIIKIISPLRARKTSAWACGYRNVSSRMHNTAEGFHQPLKQLFAKWISIERRLPTADDEHSRYQLLHNEKIWTGFYLPLRKFFIRLFYVTQWFQQGKLTTYLLYIGVTLVVLLIGVMWL